MSDQSSPPKPKPGSLRDRIAAFENKTPSQQGPPIPRPKPGAVQWKPRPPSPPSPENPQSAERKPVSTGTMSTSDAIESIGRGGSLKERMAALQGKGAFGGPPPPIAPKPNVERPKWKPPAGPTSVADDESKEVVAGVEAGVRDASRSPPPRAATSPSPENQGTSNREGDPVPHNGGGADLGPEEDERQRRAAIAARMARLGGARLGMGPPIFAPKPVVRKADPLPSALNSEDLPVNQPSLESSQVLETPLLHDLPATASPVPKPAAETERKDEHELHASVIPRAPSSMPVPAGPRRAAPPRKKAPKNAPTSEPPVEEAEGVTPATTDELSADRVIHDEPLAVRDPQEIAEAAEIVDATSDERSTIPANAEHLATQPPASIEASQEPEKHDVEGAGHVVEASTHTVADDQQSERLPEMDQLEEEDEETHRQRVAVRLAQMGAFNPLAGPPPVPRRASSDEPAPVRSEEPLDVEDEVNVDTEEYGETIPPPPTDPTRLVEAQPVKDDAAESLETDQDHKLDEDAQAAHRDGERALASYTEEEPIEHSVADVVAEQAQGTAFEVSESPGTDAHASRRDDACSVAENENESKDVVEHVNEPPPRVGARPTVPPPVNLRSKPTQPSSPPLSPPPKMPLQALKVDEEPPASPDMPPRPIPPPGRSSSVTEDPPSPPPRRSMPPPPRRTSVRVTEALAEPSSPPPVPISSRPINRRPDTPPIITTRVEEPTSETHEREHGEELEKTTAQPEEDEAAARRRAIAERMARLGGIRFGGPPPMNPLSRPPLPAAPPPTSVPPDELESEDREEEEEARKQRIAAKLAGMGGMRLGMLPPGAPVRRATREDESEDAVPVPVPAPTRKPPPPISADVSFTTEPESQDRESDDRVRVEAGETEVRYSDTEAPLSEEDAPGSFWSAEALPTPPPRVSRSPPPGRPPVPTIPTTLLGRRASGATASSRQASLDKSSETPHPQSEYVMVEVEGEEDVVSPLRRRSTRGARSIALPPPPPPSAVDPPEAFSMSMMGAQWELPMIPQSQEGEEVASSGWSEDSTAVHVPPAVSSAPSSRRASTKGVLSTSRSGSVSASGSGFGSGFGSGSGLVVRDQQEMTTDELVAVSQRVGARVVDAGTALFEKSKRMLVGDGSYAGFVRTTLGQAGITLSTTDEWGYAVYVQTGNAVQRRVSDIRPGDVIAFWDAKLKGHKALHPYTQTVGVGESAPLVGIVNEFDVKKSKVRVWQANQHVGQQTVENVSYRLEDLKGGVVKVYRVLDA